MNWQHCTRNMIRIAAVAVSLLCFAQGMAFAAEDDLAAGFTQPPDAARPWVYWFWLNGNISKEGVTADLEAMKKVGIGGVLIMEVDQGAPQGPVDFMSPRWRELFQHVHAEAKRLGMEVNMNNDAGWNGSGGPWITPEQSMQKLVWSETPVAGGQRFEASLKQPETVAGYYRDLCVLAVPAPGDYRIERVRAKAMFEVGGVGHIDRSDVPRDAIIDPSKIITITGQMDDKGHIAWDAPAGSWVVLRFGHTCTGAENAPAPKTGRGLECDKLSVAGIEANFAGMMGPLAKDNNIGPAVANAGLVATHIDSWENGSQNWTARMREEFQQRRGYDMMSYLPVVTGRVVGNLEISERFLWDLRQTVSELVIEKYAGRMHELAKSHGMRFTVEAYGSPCDSIDYAGQSDEPMGEFWTPTGTIETCRTMASAAHVYGKSIVGAESFTSADQEKWREHPAMLKALGDRAFCEGINRFVFHRYAMQPWAQTPKPGMTMGPWGQHYERTQTWWDWSIGWHAYLARCQYLLRQGLYVADVCYLSPEMPPQGPRDIPQTAYSWDEASPQVVLQRMSVDEGRLRLPDGMSYRLLVLPQGDTMTPRLLRKISELVSAGATVVGPKPSKSPSLAGYPECDAEVRKLADELWGDCDGQKVKEHGFGKGRVVWGIPTEKVLHGAHIPPDFSGPAPLKCLHRRTNDADMYFVADPRSYETAVSCGFRVTGKLPELWWPETGKREAAAVFAEKDGVTYVSWTMPPTGSVFVVFRQPVPAIDRIVSVKRDGKILMAAAPAIPLPIEVVSARYGVLDDPAKTRDVTKKVQAQVDAGNESILVTSLADGDDPAFGSVKTLVVDYRIAGKAHKVQAKDSGTVRLSAGTVRAVIEKARYGILDDPAKTRDVREKLQRLVDAGESSFTVARMAEGDDPAFMVVKTLELEFTINGKRVQTSGKDPEVIVLAPDAIQPAPPAKIVRTANDQLAIEVREPGTYELVNAAGKTQVVKVDSATSPDKVSGPFQVKFTSPGGPAEPIAMETLASWSDHANAAVKYYSGEATYSTKLSLKADQLAAGRRVYLDLGDVQVMAQVTLNGKSFEPMWKRPFRLDITDAVKPNDNQLEVRVVNLWPNRQIGDELLPEDSERNPDGTLKRWPDWVNAGKTSPTGRTTFTSWRLWRKGDSLLPSGLLGPITIESRSQVPVAGSQ